MTPKDRLIVALDRSSRDDVMRLVDRLAGTVGMFKIGLQAFVASGPPLVREIVARGEQVFLDLKVHDIPNTARNAIGEIASLGVSITTIHTSGGLEMMKACATTAPSSLLVAGVTILTSLDDASLESIGFGGRARESVVRLTALAREAGIRGVVASPLEIRPLRESHGDSLVIITPGIRPGGSGADDQRRTMTAAEAVASGADYLVVGRPITGADDPRSAASSILDEIAG